MKNFIVSFFMLSVMCYGNPSSIYVDDDIATKPTVDVYCAKDNMKLNYKIEYKTDMGVPPCEVYSVINGKTTLIAQSINTKGLCEKVIEKIRKSMEAKGMKCK
jgi:hypothetical protein